MKKLTRQEAKAAGLPRCFGSACPKHLELDGERYVSGACVACAASNLKKSRQANPERTKAHQAKSRLRVKVTPELKAKKNAQDAAYRRANKEKCTATIRQWREKNRALSNSYVRKAKAKNPAIVLANTVKRRLAKLHRTPSWLTTEDHWMIEQAYELAVLRAKLFGFSWHVDHVIPLQGKLVSGLHTPYNLQVIPGIENVRKSNTFGAVS
jgi:hypothetical protein